MYDDYMKEDGVYSGQKYEYSGGVSYSSETPSPDDNKEKKKKKGGFFKKALAAVLLGVLFGTAAGGAFYAVDYFTDYGDTKEVKDETPVSNVELPATQAVSKDDDDTEAVQVVTQVTDVTEVVDAVMPSLVSIKGVYKITSQNFFGQTFSQETEGSGSGIILAQDDNNLLIATNNHVVEDASALEVVFIDGSTASANIKGTDEDMDLAVITVNLSDISSDTRNAISIAKLGDSDSLKVGQAAIAIGNSLGYGQSVTTGVISALDRSLTISSTGETVSGLIQTDAAINPGNSGGALVNMNGEVIGINSSKIGGSQVDGVGFAIPISSASPILQDIVSSAERIEVSEANRGFLGINGVSVTEEASAMYGMPVGVQVRKIYEGTGAAESDMQLGDIIKKVATKSVGSMEDLREELKYYSAGETVNITVYRFVDGEYKEVSFDLTLCREDQLTE